MKEIKKITFNWHQCGNTTDGLDQDFQVHEVGKHFVIKIEEHRAAGEGDKWYYDIHFEDGTIAREFNVNSVIFSKEGEGLPF